jgi:hypothetical protein
MHLCRLSLKAQRDLRRLEEQFPKMAEVVKQALRELQDKAGADNLTEAVPVSPGLLVRQVISPEVQAIIMGNPGFEDSADEVAPDYFVFYEPFSLRDRIRYRARQHVIRILSSNDIVEQFSGL